jgi:hypothetical protein
MIARLLLAAAALALTPLAACAGGAPAAEAKDGMLAVTIKTAKGAHVFNVEVARTPEQQERGLMFRTDIPKDGGMIFAPYPAGGGGPRAASFWMKNTPTPLDIIFIRADGTIARLAENTIPFSEAPIASGEPVAAVLELVGGRAAETGVSEGDKVSWPGRK